MIPVIEAFVRTVVFMDRLRKEGRIRDYALVGGLALSAWVDPRNTKDVDLAVSVAGDESWSVIADFVESRLRKRTVIKKGSRRNVIQDKLSFMVGQIEVDLIGTRGFALAEDAVEHALEATVFGRRVKIATPEYLILLKLLPLRAQDRLDIGSLVKKADRRKLRTLAKRHLLLAKLESVLKKKASESGSAS